MMKCSLRWVAMLCAATLYAQDFETFKPAKSEKVLFSCGFETPEIPGAHIRKDCSIVRGAGVNGNTGFVIERKKIALKHGIWSSFDIPNTVPGITYRVEASVRQQGLTQVKRVQGFLAAISVESSYKDTGKGVPWRYGTTHHMVDKIAPEYEHIQFRFQAKENMNHFIVLRMMPGWKGKLFFDDIKVIEEGVKGTVLLTWPSTHSFEPGDGSFILHGDLLPAGCRIQAKLLRNGKILKSMILEPDKKGNFSGDWGKVEPGEAEMKVFAGVPAKKELVYNITFPVHFLKEKRPATAVTLDKYGRTIVGGKPFLPVGISTEFNWKDKAKYKRIADGGFTVVGSFAMLRRPGNQDPAHYFDDIKKGLDLIRENGLYAEVTTAILLDYYPYRVRKIGNASTMEEKLAAVVKAIGKHPAILNYYNSDEVPEEFLGQVLAMRQILNRLDPNHPVQALTNDPKLLPKFGQLGDIFSNDCYPIMKKGDVRDLSSIQLFMAQGRRAGVPLWACAQAFNWGHYMGENLTPQEYASYADPTAEEIRSMILLYAIEGARGFHFYTYPWNSRIKKQSVKYGVPDHPAKMWKSTVEAIKVLRSVEDLILGENGPEKLNVSDKKGKSAAALLQSDTGKKAVFIVGVKGRETECIVTVPGMSNLKSRFGRTGNLGNGRYLFKGPGAASDILEQ